MDRAAIIEKTTKIINKLPADKAAEVSEFASFILKKHEERLSNEAMSDLAEQSKAYMH